MKTNGNQTNGNMKTLITLITACSLAFVVGARAQQDDQQQNADDLNNSRAGLAWPRSRSVRCADGFHRSRVSGNFIISLSLAWKLCRYVFFHQDPSETCDRGLGVSVVPRIEG